MKYSIGEFLIHGFADVYENKYKTWSIYILLIFITFYNILMGMCLISAWILVIAYCIYLNRKYIQLMKKDKYPHKLSDEFIEPIKTNLKNRPLVMSEVKNIISLINKELEDNYSQELLDKKKSYEGLLKEYREEYIIEYRINYIYDRLDGRIIVYYISNSPKEFGEFVKLYNSGHKF